ncbi:hypothetical protein WICMUC_001372 [Wickerhamomyces mucosus]|uniref:Uncharacterized protein n=1 Tax=Wickerhamomyces mucosus TaxID=1378264 RepID=A0A9P8PUF5_9ASCO|nr:hypothetical protein WICMUC_001372 [Wickerhamomyces mucosus]
MDVNNEISHFKELGYSFDDNLYVALTLSLISKRHLLLESKDNTSSIKELQLIINNIWEIQPIIINFEQRTYEKDELFGLFLNEEDYFLAPIYIINGIDGLPHSSQSLLLEFMKRKSISLNDKEFRCNEIFTIIGLFSNQNNILSFLRNEFWFKQFHIPIEQPNPIMTTKYSLNKVRHFAKLNKDLNDITILPELKRYIYDIVIFVRNHRVVDTGLPTVYLAELELMSRALCVIFNREFVIPTIVKLSARKLIPLHLTLINYKDEPSLQWGGDIEIAKELMKRMTPEIVIEDVLRKVDPPL